MRFAPLLPAGAHVLDVAAGHGRNARWLAQAGFHVTAIDRDEQALGACGAARTVCVDLEAGPPPLAGQRFDAVVVMNYLHRPLFAAISGWLAPHGILIYETFAKGQELVGRPTNPDFLLQRGELLRAFAGLTVVAFEDGIVNEGQTRVVQRLCASADSMPKALG